MKLPVQPPQIETDRIALAPYNFVPLPEKVVTLDVKKDLPDQGWYDPDRLTGRVECALTTESPLYTRAGVTPEEYEKGQRGKDQPGGTVAVVAVVHRAWEQSFA